MRLANQALMIVSAWGDPDGARGRSMKWTELAAELQSQLGVPPTAMVTVAPRYGMHLDVETDRFTITDIPALTAQLRRELGR
jgi:hypothetical protein